MTQQAQGKISRNHAIVSVAIVISIIVLLITTLIWQILQPKRSVENFCKVVNEERDTLEGDTSHKAKLNAYKRLEAVSPDSIRDDVTSMRKGYEAIVNDPSTGWGVGFGTVGSAGRISDFANENCDNHKKQ